MAVEPEPPDPSFIGFAAKGLGLLNVALAARLNAPEFAQIPDESNETVAAAWLKFAGYYVSFAKATGPMGALATAVVVTAYVYAPPAMVAAQRRHVKASPPASPPAAPAGEPFVIQPAEAA